jgi:type VI secretion system secreted protein VgrG
MANKIIFMVDYNQDDSEKPIFDVICFEGREAISMPFKFTVELRSTADTNIKFTGKMATLGILMDDISASENKAPTEDPDTEPLKEAYSAYRGRIASFYKKDRIGDYYHYTAILAPTLSSLGLFKKSDVFIQTPFCVRAGQCIMRAVLAEGSVSDYSIETVDSYLAPNKANTPPDPDNRFSYVCQYEETDLDFISRLMEREGIYYFIEQPTLAKSKDTGEYVISSQGKTVFTDSSICYLSRQKSMRYRFLSEQPTAPDPDAISTLSLEQNILPGKVTITNYNYTRTALGQGGVIECSANVDTTMPGEVRIYGENFVSNANGGDGQFLAKRRADEIFCRGSLYSGRSTAVPFAPGMKITLNDGAPASFKQDYFIIEVAHRGQQQLPGAEPVVNYPPFYENEFVMIPYNIQFRPERKTPRPKINGTMNAFVDGPLDSENKLMKYAQIDALGRYKVKLPFLSKPKDPGKGSVWIRMATPYAGGGETGNAYGMNFPLLEGTEVALSFRDGDPDQPVITGALFNSSYPNIVQKPASEGATDTSRMNIIKTAGGHKIVMNDEEGKKSFGLFCSHGFKDSKKEGDEDGSWLSIGNEEDPTWQLKSKGSKHDVVCGQADAFTIGAQNSIVIGERTTMAVGNVNDITVATRLAAALVASFDIKFGEFFEFGKACTRVRYTDSLTATDEVTLGGGVPIAEKGSIWSIGQILLGALAALSALVSASSADLISIGFPDPAKGGAEGHELGKSLGATTGIITGAIITQLVTITALMANLRKTRFHPTSKVTLNAAGVEMKGDSTMTEGIRIGVERVNALTSNMQIKPYSAVSPDALKDKITISNNNNAILEMDKGETITIKRTNAAIELTKIVLNDQKVEITGPGGATKVTVGEGNEIEIKAGTTASSPTILMRNNSIYIKMQLGAVDSMRAIMISNNEIKMQAGMNIYQLTPDGANTTASFIKLG